MSTALLASGTSNCHGVSSNADMIKDETVSISRERESNSSAGSQIEARVK